MARGTFANIRLFNKFLNKQAPQTIHLPTGEAVSMQHLSLTLWHPLISTKFYYLQFNSCVFFLFCPAGCIWCCREIPAGRIPSDGSGREGVRLRQLQGLGSKGPLSAGEDHVCGNKYTYSDCVYNISSRMTGVVFFFLAYRTLSSEIDWQWGSQKNKSQTQTT